MSSLNTNNLIQSSIAFIWVKKELAELPEALEYFQPLLTVFDTPGLGKQKVREARGCLSFGTQQSSWEHGEGTGKGCSLPKASCLSPNITQGVNGGLRILVPLFCRSELFRAQEKRSSSSRAGPRVAKAAQQGKGARFLGRIPGQNSS